MRLWVVATPFTHVAVGYGEMETASVGSQGFVLMMLKPDSTQPANGGEVKTESPVN